MAQSKRISASPFPIKVFTFALVLTIILFAGLSWLVFSSYKEFETTKTQDFRLQELNGIITHLDEVLTMSARMAVATGNLQWEERYRSFEPHLNTAIKEAARLAPETFMSKAAARTDAANVKLVAMENRAFDLVRQGNRKVATALLYSEEYEEQKRIYAKGMQQIALAIQERIKATLYAKRQQAFFTVISAIVALLILLFAWVGVMGTVRKRIAERKQAVDALWESEKFFSGTLNDLLTFVGVLGPSGKVIFINNTPIEAAGIKREDVLGKMFYDTYWWAYSEETQQTIKEDIERCASGETFAREIQIQMAAGSLMWIDFSMHPIYGEEGEIKYLVPEGRDITERKWVEEALKRLNEKLEQRVEERTQELKDAQEQLVRREKLATLGQLAGSVSHELRNPLGVIGNSVYYLKMKFKEEDDKMMIKHLDILQREVKRSNKLISTLLDFSIAKPPSLEEGNLNSIVKGTLVEIEIPGNITIETQLDKDLPGIPVDPEQIRQVFQNLISNALQAMPEGGRLTIKTRAKDEFVEIMFSDTGEGITRENLLKIFEPLFTTKAKGIGLGLAIAKGIIDSHKGSIEVESEVGEGTNFTVKLPRELMIDD